MWQRTIPSDELWHHGILGQKHGKRNGPPYPLDSDDHSSKEKSAGWKESLNAKDTKARHKELAKKYKDERKEMREAKKRKKAHDKNAKQAEKDAKRVNRSIEKDKDYKSIKEARDKDDIQFKEWFKKNEKRYSQGDKRKAIHDYYQETKSDNKYKELSAMAEKHLRKKMGKKYDQKIKDPYRYEETTRGAMALDAYIKEEERRRRGY